MISIRCLGPALLKNRSTEIGSLVVNVRGRSKRQRDMERNRMREESKTEKMCEDMACRNMINSKVLLAKLQLSP